MRKIRDIYNHYDINDKGCWIWKGNKTEHGYGVIQENIGIQRLTRLVHRLYYKKYKGEIPDNYELHHACYEKSCVNPEHLQCLLRSEHLAIENTIYKTKTHCKNGHEYNEENTYYPRKGNRQCRICNRMRLRIR